MKIQTTTLPAAATGHYYTRTYHMLCS